MGKIDELLATVERFESRVAGVEKSIESIGREQGAAAEAIRKAMSASGRRDNDIVGGVGWDGSDQMGLLRIAGGVRQKAIGWGPFLDHVDMAMNDKRSGPRTDRGQVEKALERMGSLHIRRKASLAEGSGSTGGYTVPVQFYADLLRLIAEESFVRSRCTILPMQSRSMLIPALTQSSVPSSGTSAFFGGIIASWQAEAATYNESDPVFRQIEMIARDLVFITVASNQLLQDNAVALDTLLTTLFKEAMAWFFDYYILRGNGAGQPFGVVNAPATIAVTRNTPSRFKLPDAATMLSKLLVSSWQNAVWVMHVSLLPELIQMADSTNGRLVWLNQMPAGGAEQGGGVAQRIPMSLFGIPIFWTEKLPALGSKGDVLLCDFSKILVGDRLAIQIETSPHVKFTTNQMVWRIITRWDAQPWLDSYITLADGAFTVSPYVTLAA